MPAMQIPERIAFRAVAAWIPIPDQPAEAIAITSDDSGFAVHSCYLQDGRWEATAGHYDIARYEKALRVAIDRLGRGISDRR